MGGQQARVWRLAFVALAFVVVSAGASGLGILHALLFVLASGLLLLMAQYAFRMVYVIVDGHSLGDSTAIGASGLMSALPVAWCAQVAAISLPRAIAIVACAALLAIGVAACGD